MITKTELHNNLGHPNMIKVEETEKNLDITITKDK